MKKKQEMSIRKAVRLALKALDQEIRKVCVDANFAERYGATYPHALRCVEKRNELREAKVIVSQLFESWLVAGCPRLGRAEDDGRNGS